VILSGPNEIALQRIEKHYGQILKDDFSFLALKPLSLKSIRKNAKRKKMKIKSCRIKFNVSSRKNSRKGFWLKNSNRTLN
jgi:hypothetical protein